jgi:hypothetical protein
MVAPPAPLTGSIGVCLSKDPKTALPRLTSTKTYGPRIGKASYDPRTQPCTSRVRNPQGPAAVAGLARSTRGKGYGIHPPPADTSHRAPNPACCRSACGAAIGAGHTLPATGAGRRHRPVSSVLVHLRVSIGSGELAALHRTAPGASGHFEIAWPSQPARLDPFPCGQLQAGWPPDAVASTSPPELRDGLTTRLNRCRG